MTVESPEIATFLVVAGVLWLTSGSSARLIQSYIRNLSLPPGPKGLPLIGDVIHAADGEWLAAPERRDEYGDMMYLNVLGKGILVINNQRVAIDLLDKRSNTTSDRSYYISGGDFMTKNLSLTLSPYGDILRRFRRVATEGFSKLAVQSFQPIQNREAIILALKLMKSPRDLEKHFYRHAASIMLSVNYHLPPAESEDDPLVVGFGKHAWRLLNEVKPGTRLVEYIPWLRYIPDGFAKWKRDAQYWFVHDSTMFKRLLGIVADDLANGIDRPSFAATVIKTQGKHDFSELERAWLVGDMVAAGGETTSVTLRWWLLAMLVYPSVQARAHAELDEVVGRARPPTFADLPSLPYIRAMVKEIVRWSSLTPFGVPHSLTADEWYEGKYIPKGTVIFPNTRLFNFDTEIFGANAADFDPTRYLDEKGHVKSPIEGREDGHLAFGFGRRVCLGKHFVEGTLAIDFATLLWAMRFERPEGSKGELDVQTRIHSGLTVHPVDFECKALPRFAEAEALLNESKSLYE